MALSTQGSAPYPYNGILEVFSIEGQTHRVQRYTTWNELIFVRTMENNVWQPWREVPRAGRLKTVGGQSIIGSGDIPGGVGVGQTWQDVTASRALNITYTNTTGKPIFLGLEGTFGRGAYDVNISVTINGYSQRIAVNSSTYGTTNVAGTILIPIGATYSVSMFGAALSKWSELR